MNNCENVNIPTFMAYHQLSNSCALSSTSSDYSVATPFTGVSNFSYISYRSFKFLLCEYDDSNFSNGRLIKSSYSSFDVELDSTKYYSYQLFKRNECNNCVALTYCNPKSQIQLMSEELALGSGNSLFTNLNELTPLFIILIGLILGYWFLRKIIKKGQKGGTL